MPLPSPKARVPPKVTNIFDICFIYIYYIFYSCDNSPPFKTFTPPNMYMFLTPPIRRCFFRVFIFRRSDHRSPVAYFSIATPQSALPTAPLNGSLTNCLSLRRGGTKCRSGGFCGMSWMPSHTNKPLGRPMIAPTNKVFTY